jgi:hypothetical protein
MPGKIIWKKRTSDTHKKMIIPKAWYYYRKRNILGTKPRRDEINLEHANV